MIKTEHVGRITNAEDQRTCTIAVKDQMYGHNSYLESPQTTSQQLYYNAVN